VSRNHGTYLHPAIPPCSGAGHCVATQLQQFCHARIDTLLEKAEAVRYGSAEVTYSGNAYLVTFVADTAVLRHHHVADWPKVRVPLAEFIQRLRAWAE